MPLSKITLSSLFLALCMVLPLLTGQIKEIGNALCPMHIPVLLCGFFCGPVCGFTVGALAPLLRFLLFGMPPILPVGTAMCFELAAYGLVSGLLYRALPQKKINIYVSLILAMLTGRIVWGTAMVVISTLGKSAFGWQAFIAGAFLNAIPGIIIQIVLIPVLVAVIKRNTANSY